jgi:hypothetical protein
VQKNDHRAIGRAGFGVSDIQEAGIDLLERAEGRSCSCCRLAPPRRRSRELHGREGHARSPKEAAAMMINFFGRFDCMQWNLLGSRRSATC